MTPDPPTGNMTDYEPSRRALLRYGGVGAVATLAGCLFGDSDDQSPNGDDDGSPNGEQNGQENGNGEPNYVEAFDLAGEGAATFKHWLVPGNPRGLEDDVTSIFGFLDFDAEAAQGIDWMGTRRSELAEVFQAEPEAFNGELIVGDPNSSRERRIQLGEFDPDAVVETLQENAGVSVVGEYNGYTVIEGQQGEGAVGPDAILSLPIYDQYIDAKRGEGERLTDVDEPVGHVLDVLPGGFQLSISRHGNIEDLAVNGSTFHDIEDGFPNRTTRAFVFHDEADATTERAREIISIGQTDFEEILAEEQHGRMVMTEYTQDWGESES